VLHTTPEHEELKTLDRGCITRHHMHHYLGFARTQWELFEKERPRRVKPLLHVYLVLLTGIHLMRTGRVEANLLRLNEEFRLPYVPELVERNLAGPERSHLAEADLEFHRREFERLEVELKRAGETSALPEAPSGRSGLEALLIQARMGRLGVPRV
jgi:hypothetical protein